MFNDFQEDHCPQKSGQSSLSGRYCVVLTCHECNPLAGATYEAEADQIKRGKREARRETAYVDKRPSGIWVVGGVKDNAEVLTDLKSAFLIAFAVLGYRFAFAPALRPIRASIIAGASPRTAGGSPRFDGFPPHSVTEVFSSEDAVGSVVVAGEDHMWNLPAGSRALSDPSKATYQRTWDWPPIEKSGNRKAMQAMLEGGDLFHTDHCHKHDHHVLHGHRLPRSKWPVNVEEAEPAERFG